MKRFVLLSSLLFLCLAHKPLDKSDLLIKRWVLKDFYDPRLEKDFETKGITQERRQLLMQKLVEGSFIEFKTDGTYEVSILGSEPEKLFWFLNEDESFLMVKKYPQDRPQRIELETLSKKELVIVLPERKEDGGYTRMFFIPGPAVAASAEDR